MNSLYGRFGMDDNFVNINVIHKDYFNDFENKFLDQIVDKIDLGDHVLFFFNKLNETNENDNSTHNVSISIAAAITAYARIHMSQFKNNPKINLYYTDTDSAYTDSDIDDSLIDAKVLGKLKLETTNKRAIFLTPKVYCLETVDGEFIHKVKGLSHDIKLTFQDFEKLLFKDALIEKSQTKWFRNLSEGKINLLEEVYTLKVNDNKRELVYKNNKLIATKPYKINSDKVIDIK
jgi:DNA polymerase type B, organellar and viral